MKTKQGLIVTLAFLLTVVCCHGVKAAQMGESGKTDIFLAHSCAGWGSLTWRQYDESHELVNAVSMMNSSAGDDVGYIKCNSAYGWDGSTVNMGYLITNTGWSDVRLQVFNSDGSKNGSQVILESDSQDGYRKYYTGMEVLGVTSTTYNMYLTGKNSSGNSAVFMSTYNGTTRESQIELKSYDSDLSLYGTAAGDWDNDGNMDVFVGRTTGTGDSTTGIITRLEFDSDWNLIGETDTYISIGLWSDMSVLSLDMADIDDDGSLDLLVSAGQTTYGCNSVVFDYESDGSGGYVKVDNLIGLTNGYYWTGVSTLASVVPEPLTLGMVLAGGSAVFIKRRKK